MNPEPYRSLIISDPVSTLPILFLWPHSRCNCRCIMCDIWKIKSKQEITATEIAQWMQEWRKLGVQQVILTGGEALLHSDLWSLCRLLKSNGITITLLSTGLTLYRFAHEVVQYCDRINVSLDGPQEIHNSIRGIPKAFEKLAQSIEAVKSIDPKFTIYGRCAIHRKNYRSLRAIVDAAHEIKLDRLSFLATDITSEAFNRPNGWAEAKASDIALKEEDLMYLEQELDALETTHAADFASGYINESSQQLRRKILQFYRAHHKLSDFYPNICNAPWVSAFIEFDGTVRPCFFQKAYGNLHDYESLEALLNTETALEFRHTLDVQSDPICKRCVCALSVYSCDCGLSRIPPYCDNSCLLAQFFSDAF